MLVALAGAGFASGAYVYLHEEGSSRAAEPPPPAAPVPNADVLWYADQETGDLSQWTLDDRGGQKDTGTGTTRITSDRVHLGRYSLALTITNVREKQATRNFRWGISEGTSLPVEGYYSAWYFFPRVWRPKVYWNVFQWKTKVDADTNDPTFVLNVGARRGRMYLYLYDAVRARPAGDAKIDLPTGRWVHIEAFYRFATDNSGRVTFWQDGQQILDVQGVQTQFPSSDQNARQWSVDSYSNGLSPDDATIYVDDAAISLTRLGPGARVGSGAVSLEGPGAPRRVLRGSDAPGSRP